MGSRTAAWLVHAYTAAGAVLALLATRAVARHDYREAFIWLLLSTAIDASDGVLARAAHVKTRLPHISGARLDDIVDYLTFVFVPAFLVWEAGLLPAAVAPLVAGAMLISSAYGFSQEDAKSADHFFTGFPSYWNIVALYLFVAGLPPAVNATVLVTLAVLVFVPIGYIYPSRTPTLRTLTTALALLWAAAMIWVVWRLPAVDPGVVWISLVFPIYYTGLSLALHRRRG